MKLQAQCQALVTIQFLVAIVDIPQTGLRNSKTGFWKLLLGISLQYLESWGQIHVLKHMSHHACSHTSGFHSPTCTHIDTSPQRPHHGTDWAGLECDLQKRLGTVLPRGHRVEMKGVGAQRRLGCAAHGKAGHLVALVGGHWKWKWYHGVSKGLRRHSSKKAE